MTYTDSDFERFYLRYKAEALPLDIPVKTYCIRNNVPYNKFNKWFRDTRHRIVPVVVDGMPEGHGDSVEEAIPTEGQQPTSAFQEQQPFDKTRQLRIMVDIRMTNGLHLRRRNMSYAELRDLVERLEGICFV